MARRGVLLHLGLSAVLFALIGCGGGGMPTPRLETGGVAGSGDSSQTGLFPVRMNPQAVELSGGWPLGRTTSGLAAQAGLAVPPETVAALPRVKGAAYLEANMVKSGDAFDVALPNNRIIKVAAPSVLFSPVWGSQSRPQLSDAAYCIYRFSLAGFATSGELQTLALSWYAGCAPTDFKNLWIGLANRTTDRWDWYAGPADGVLTLASYAAYTAGNGDVLVAIVLLGSDDCVLQSLKAGAAEMRAMGVVPGSAGQDDTPLPAGEASLPASVDLSPWCSPVGDQGQIGSGTSFAAAHGAFDYALGQVYGAGGWDFDDAFNMASTKFLYLQTGDDCGAYAGRSTSLVVSYLETNGDATEHNCPYTNYCDRDWGQEAAADALLLCTRGTTSINPAGSGGVAKLKHALARLRQVVIVQTGLDWDFFNLGPDEVWNYTGESLAGYQAMALVGYDDAKQAFKVRNSWGTAWAGGGYCWIGYQTFIDADPDLWLWAWTLKVDYDAAAAQRFCGQQAELAPPTGLQASDGTYGDRIQLNWIKSAGATGYKIYRDQQTNPLVTVGDVATWNNSSVPDYLSHVYWVKAVAAGKESAFSSPDAGFLAQEPVLKSITPESGDPGEVVTLLAQVGGRLPMTYRWYFGGGATPDNSSESSPQVTLGDIGFYNASLRLTNDIGIATYQFTLTVGVPGGVPVDITAYDIQALGASGGSGANADIFGNGEMLSVVANQSLTLKLNSVTGTWDGEAFNATSFPGTMTQADYDKIFAGVAGYLNWSQNYGGAAGLRLTSLWFIPSKTYATFGDPGDGVVFPDYDPESDAAAPEGINTIWFNAGHVDCGDLNININVSQNLYYDFPVEVSADPSAPVIEGYYSDPSCSAPLAELALAADTTTYLKMTSWGASGAQLPADASVCQLQVLDVYDYYVGIQTIALTWYDGADHNPGAGEFCFYHSAALMADVFVCTIPGAQLEPGVSYALRFFDGATWSSINLPASLLATI